MAIRYTVLATAILALASSSARAQYMDGLPVASAVTGSDIIPICQGGVALHPGTCTTRQTTVTGLGLGGGGNVTNSTSLATGSSTARTLGNRAADELNVLDYGAAGTGGDDVVGIQAAINRAAATGANEVFFPQPSSGHYNICAAGIQLPGQSVSLHLVGATVGGTSIRVLPGCATPPTSMFVQPITTNQADTVRVTFSHLTIDGYCLATNNFLSNYSAGMAFDHVNFRNVAPGGTNVRLVGGYEYDLGNTNTIENVNDPGHTCYAASANLPLYNLWTSATDSRFDGLIAVNAKTANIYQDSGGNNRYIGTHTWNYYDIPFGGTQDLRSQYGYIIKGAAALIGAYAEDFLTSGMFIQNSANLGAVRVIGNHFGFTGNPSNTVVAIELDNLLTYSTVTDNEAWQLNFISHPEHIIVQDGTSGVGMLVHDNNSASYSTPFSLVTPGTATQEVSLTLHNPSTASFALTQMNMTAGSATGAFSFQDAGTSLGGYFTFQPPTSSGAAPVIVSFDGTDGLVSLGGNVGSEALRAVYAASTVNRVEVLGATAGNDPIIQTAGSDTNIPLIISSKGTGQVFIEPGGLVEQTVTGSGTQTTHGLAVGAPTGGLAGAGIANVATDYRVNNVSVVPLKGTTGSIGGGALAAGACASGTATVTGVSTAMALAVAPAANPQVDATHGLSIWAYMSGANTVTVEVCAIVATTPVAQTYVVRAIQ